MLPSEPMSNMIIMDLFSIIKSIISVENKWKSELLERVAIDFTPSKEVTLFEIIESKLLTNVSGITSKSRSLLLLKYL